LLPDGTVLVARGKAGVGGIDNTSLNTAELYDSTAGTLTFTANSMFLSRVYHTATLLNDGTVLIAGGEQAHGCCVAFNNAEVYTPASRMFSNVSSMSFARALHTLTLLPNGRVHMIGGGDTITEIYDPIPAAFLQSTALQLQRTNHTATLLPNNAGLLVCGGIVYPPAFSPEITASCEIVP
jgi:hypothetical protein